MVQKMALSRNRWKAIQGQNHKAKHSQTATHCGITGGWSHGGMNEDATMEMTGSIGNVGDGAHLTDGELK